MKLKDVLNLPRKERREKVFTSTTFRRVETRLEMKVFALLWFKDEDGMPLVLSYQIKRHD